MHITINSLSFLLIVLTAVLVPVESESVSVHELSSHMHSSTLATMPADAPQARQNSGAACIGIFDQDPEAMADFQQKVGSVVRDMMEQEIKKFVENMSQQAMGQLTDQLLSFSLMGQRYLCLNIVCHPAPSLVPRYHRCM